MITVTCSICGATLNAPDTLSGKPAPCKKCGQTLWIPEERAPREVPPVAIAGPPKPVAQNPGGFNLALFGIVAAAVIGLSAIFMIGAVVLWWSALTPIEMKDIPRTVTSSSGPFLEIMQDETVTHLHSLPQLPDDCEISEDFDSSMSGELVLIRGKIITHNEFGSEVQKPFTYVWVYHNEAWQVFRVLFDGELVYKNEDIPQFLPAVPRD